MRGCIVVGTDGSETGARALGAAIELAQVFSQPLHVVSAYRPRVQPTNRVESILAEAESRCRRAGISVTIHARVGDAAEAILDVADRLEADLIVVGSRRIGLKTRFFLGNVSSKVVHHAGCSTHVVHTS